MDTRRFELTASPHIKGPDSTPRIMWSVVGSLVPVVAAAVYWFGPSAFLVIAAASIGIYVQNSEPGVVNWSVIWTQVGWIALAGGIVSIV